MEVQAYSFNDMIMFADRVCNTDFVPQVYKNKPAEILAAVMYGQEIGLPPMSALKHIVVIKGTPALTSHAMRALVQGKGHSIYTLDGSNATQASVYGKRTNGDEMTVTWTIEKARQAGLGTGDGWKKYPEEMLVARATSQLCRQLFADVISGLCYSAEEAQDFDTPSFIPRQDTAVINQIGQGTIATLEQVRQVKGMAKELTPDELIGLSQWKIDKKISPIIHGELLEADVKKCLDEMQRIIDSRLEIVGVEIVDKDLAGTPIDPDSYPEGAIVDISDDDVLGDDDGIQ